MINKITNNLEGFNYNVIIANIYEIYNFMNKEIEKEIDSEVLRENYKKILILFTPAIPHFTAECLKELNFLGEIEWPKANRDLLDEDKIDYVIQINGKDYKTDNFNKEQNYIISQIKSLQSKSNTHKFELDQMSAALTHFTNILIDSINKSEQQSKEILEKAAKTAVVG